MILCFEIMYYSVDKNQTSAGDNSAPKNVRDGKFVFCVFFSSFSLAGWCVCFFSTSFVSFRFVLFFFLFIFFFIFSFYCCSFVGSILFFVVSFCMWMHIWHFIYNDNFVFLLFVHSLVGRLSLSLSLRVTCTKFSWNTSEIAKNKNHFAHLLHFCIVFNWNL